MKTPDIIRQAIGGCSLLSSYPLYSSGSAMFICNCDSPKLASAGCIRRPTYSLPYPYTYSVLQVSVPAQASAFPLAFPRRQNPSMHIAATNTAGRRKSLYSGITSPKG